MKVIVPAKASSVRVPEKNWRPFHEGKSLVDIKLEQLTGAFPAGDVFVSCEDPSRRPCVEKYGVKFLLRDERLAEDGAHWSDVVTGIIESIPDCVDDEDVAWVQVPCPLFGASDFAAVLACWEDLDHAAHDCLITVEDFKDFLIDEKGRPLNFQFGRWHTTSQHLPQWYMIQRQCHIMQKRTYLRLNYEIGLRPYLFKITDASVDIDNLEEFRYAQYLYAQQRRDEENIA